MSKIKDNFLKRYLPMWAKETVFAENKKLKQENAKLKQENEVLRSFMSGISVGRIMGVERREGE